MNDVSQISMSSLQEHGKKTGIYLKFKQLY